MNNLMVSHGLVTHGIDSVDNCMDCIEVNIEWYKELKNCGGVTKLKEKYLKLSKKMEKV